MTTFAYAVDDARDPETKYFDYYLIHCHKRDGSEHETNPHVEAFQVRLAIGDGDEEFRQNWQNTMLEVYETALLPAIYDQIDAFDHGTIDDLRESVGERVSSLLDSLYLNGIRYRDADIYKYMIVRLDGMWSWEND